MRSLRFVDSSKIINPDNKSQDSPTNLPQYSMMPLNDIQTTLQTSKVPPNSMLGCGLFCTTRVMPYMQGWRSECGTKKASEMVMRIIIRCSFLFGTRSNTHMEKSAQCNSHNKGTYEKVWMSTGPEFGADEGKTFLITRALYGVESASFSFWSYMAERLADLGSQLSMADHILEWSKSNSGGFEKNVCKKRNDKIELAWFYLRAKLHEKPINGLTCWKNDDVKAAIKMSKTLSSTREDNYQTTNIETPMNNRYTTPELDVAAESGEEDYSF